LPRDPAEDRAKPGPLTDEQAEDWHPARISDRKLLELAGRLETVRRLGGAFAEVALSDQAKDRLVPLEKRIPPK